MCPGRMMVVVDNLVALIPSIGTGILFVIVMRAILLADRRERAAILELEQRSEQSASRVQHDNEGSSF